MNLRRMTHKAQPKKVDSNILSIVLIENQWLDRGLISLGWGNGYVDIPITHPCFGLHYDDIDVDVHGGLTYSDLTDSGFWRVGFDTAHLGDTIDNWPREAVKQEAEYLLKQLKQME